jgi:hypothetical protein
MARSSSRVIRASDHPHAVLRPTGERPRRTLRDLLGSLHDDALAA